MDLFSIIIGISIPLTIRFISRIVCKCRDACECSCFQGLGAISGPYTRSNSYSFRTIIYINGVSCN